MSQSNSWFQQNPTWVWLTCIPVFGALAISYAGYKSKNNAWIVLGIGITGIAFVLYSVGVTPTLVWLSQIGCAFYLKKFFLAKTYPKSLPLPQEPDLLKLVIANRHKIDINECSKDDLVNYLGLPIVYANNIESLLNEGYIFTHLEELTEIAGIPEKKLYPIAQLITFSYDYKKEIDFSWKRLNTYSSEELITCGLDAAIAEKIVIERQRKGKYRSVIEVKQRTGLPFSTYRQIV